MGTGSHKPLKTVTIFNLWLIRSANLYFYFGIFCSPKQTVGVFWHNAAETWVDISNSKDANVVSSLVNLVSGHSSDSSVETHFMSESGVIDLFVFLGPTPKKAVQQYTALTGTAPLPQVQASTGIALFGYSRVFTFFSTSPWDTISAVGTTMTRTT